MTKCVAPSRLASWLLGLFTPAGAYDPVAGDLLEQFRAIATRDGETAARRWYWREAFRALPDLLWWQIRDAPLRIALIAILGCIVTQFATFWLDEPAVWLVLHFNVYSYVPAAWFWLSYRLIVQAFAGPLLIGWLAASATKRSELASTLAVSLLLIGLVLWMNQRIEFRGNSDLALSLRLQWLVRELLPVPAILLGGVLRKCSTSRFGLPAG